MKKQLKRLIIFSLFAWNISACTREEATPEVDCNASDLAIELLRKEDTECGLQDGLIEVEASGGSGNYSFRIGSGSFQSDPEFADLAAGNYQITAKDENNCETTMEVAINNTEGINIEITATTSGCNDNQGAITVTTTSGTPPFLFKIGAEDFQEDNSFPNLTQGNYTIVAKDATDCEISQEVAVKSGVSYSTTVSPIIENNCAVSGCHNGSQSPDLSEFANIQSNATSIKAQVVSGNMPKNGSLSQEQIDAIACWVDDGAPQN